MIDKEMFERRERCKERHERFKKFYEEAGVDAKLAINMGGLCRTMRSRFEQKAGQKRILMMLSEQGVLTQRELTEQLGIRPGSASEILTKLENAGLISRSKNEADGRTVDVSLTEAGAEAAKLSYETHGRQHEDMFSCLTAEEQETLLSLLEKVRADWEVRFPGHHGHHGHHGECGPHGECGRHAHHGEFGPRGHHGHCGHHGPCGPLWGRPKCGNDAE